MVSNVAHNLARWPLPMMRLSVAHKRQEELTKTVDVAKVQKQYTFSAT